MAFLQILISEYSELFSENCIRIWKILKISEVCQPKFEESFFSLNAMVMEPTTPWSILLILSICATNIETANIAGFDINCTGDDACFDYTIQCTDHQNCTLKCSGDSACEDSIVSCPLNGDCLINCGTVNQDCKQIAINATQSLSLSMNCTGDSACLESTILSPINGDFTLDCSGDSTCQDSVVSCPINANCVINCGGLYDECKRMEINATQSLSLLLDCNGKNSCRDSIITSPNNGYLNLSCVGDNACQTTEVTCPINGDCVINCGGVNDDCKDMIIDATQSLSLEVNCDPNPMNTSALGEQCDQMHIYCPQIPTATGCIVRNLNAINVDEWIKIYAIGGLQDVTITGENPTQIEIYCTSDLGATCTVNEAFDGCSSGDMICGQLGLTQTPTLPTLIPSTDPTNDPSLEPTVNPSAIPTTIYPTQSPSETVTTTNPTSDPSKDPSTDPSINPTVFKTPTSAGQNDGAILDDGKSTTLDAEMNTGDGETLSTVTMYLLIIACLAFLVCCIVSIFCIYFIRTRKTTKELQLAKLRMQSVTSDEDQSQHAENHHVEHDTPSMIYRFSMNSEDMIISDVASAQFDEVELARVNMDNIGQDGFYVKCIANYIASDEDQLNLEKGELVYVLKCADSGWWYGFDGNDNDGWLPSNYVERLDEEQDIQPGSEYVYGDNYATNLDKYLKYSLPPEIVPISTKVGSNMPDDQSVRDNDRMVETVTDGLTDMGKDNNTDEGSGESDNEKMYHDHVVTKETNDIIHERVTTQTGALPINSD